MDDDGIAGGGEASGEHRANAVSRPGNERNPGFGDW
jgi:hypothetical protein